MESTAERRPVTPEDLFKLAIIHDGRLSPDGRNVVYALATFSALDNAVQFSGNGVAVEGWLMRSPVGEAPYPTVLYIHGRPHSGFGHIFSFDFQMLAGAGYAEAQRDAMRGRSGGSTTFRRRRPHVRTPTPS